MHSFPRLQDLVEDLARPRRAKPLSTLAGALLALAPLAAAQGVGPNARPPSAGPAEVHLDPPIAHPHDGIALGNGALGALVWGDANVLRITLSRGDLRDARAPATPEDWTYAKALELARAGEREKLRALFDAALDAGAAPTALPAGRVELVYPEAQKVKRFRLDPARAEVAAGYGTSRIRVHVSALLPLVLVRADNDFPSLRIVPSPVAEQLGAKAPEAGAEGDLRWSKQELPGGASHALVVAEFRDAKGVTFAITSSFERAGRDPVAAARVCLEINPGVTYDRLAQAFHVGWWYEHWKQSWIELPDGLVQAQYDLGRRLLAAGSRGDSLGIGGAPLAPQGLWLDDATAPPWRGALDHELATPRLYAPYPALGYLEQGEALLRHLEALQPLFREHAKSFFGVDGLAVPGATTLDGRAVGGRAGSPLAPTSTAALARIFHAHWKHSGDDAFLRERAYPWCADAGRALAALLVAGDDGRLRLPISSTPPPRIELSRTSNRDLALLQSLFGSLEEMALLAKPDEAARWGEIVAKLETLDVDAASGALSIAPGVPYAARADLSHAAAIHPLGLVSIEGTEEERKVVLATLAQIESAGSAAWSGETFAAYAALCARAGLGDRALAALESALAFAGPSGLQFERPSASASESARTRGRFSLAATTAFTDAVNEMLLQGWGGTVRVFPAVPERWNVVRFEGLRAEGGWRITARRDDAGTQQVSITATRAGQLRLRDPFPGDEATWSREDVHRDGRDYVVDLAPGEALEGSRRAR